MNSLGSAALAGLPNIIPTTIPLPNSQDSGKKTGLCVCIYKTESVRFSAVNHFLGPSRTAPSVHAPMRTAGVRTLSPETVLEINPVSCRQTLPFEPQGSPFYKSRS